MTTKNKEVVRKLNKGFEADDDDEIILSCLTDSIRWDLASAFTAIGKEEICNQ